MMPSTDQLYSGAGRRRSPSISRSIFSNGTAFVGGGLFGPRPRPRRVPGGVTRSTVDQPAWNVPDRYRRAAIIATGVPTALVSGARLQFGKFFAGMLMANTDNDAFEA